tara:strand:- start:268 stop:651 length:384 start_codon:yes stop_codon:yes gene_type:complete
MRHRKPRMFKYRSNGRNFRRQVGGDSLRVVPSHFSNPKNNFKQNQSAEKLLERYKLLAKEASSSGDKILSENYLQHVDHFERIISQKNLNQNINSSQAGNLPKEKDQGSSLSDNNKVDKDKLTENKK